MSRERGDARSAGLLGATEQAADAIIVTDVGGRILYVNAAFTSITGYTSEEAVGRLPSILKSGLESDTQYKDVWKTILSGASWRTEMTNKRKDGSLYREEMRISSVHNERGDIRHFVAIKRDLSRKRAGEVALDGASIEGTSDAIITCSPAGIISSWNRGAEGLVGFRADEIIGKHISLLLPEERHPTLTERIRKIVQDEEITHFRELGLRKDNRIIDVMVTCSPIQRASGEVVGIAIALRDVTEQRREENTPHPSQASLEEAQILEPLGAYELVVPDIMARREAETSLRSNEELYRTPFKHAAIGILHTALDGRIMRCNGRFGDIVGYIEEDIPDLNINQLMVAEDQATYATDLLQMLDGSKCDSVLEVRFICNDGSVTWVKLKVSILRDGEGKALHSIALVEDINIRKGAEERLAATQESLRASEARYRTVFQTSLDPALVSRVEDGRYIDVNQAFLDLMGFEREEVMGKTSLELDLCADFRDRQTVIDALEQSSKFKNLEIHYRKKNGDNIWGLTSASVIEIEGVPCVLTIFKDVSRARIAEEEIKTLVYYDQLTGLPNRRMLSERLHETLAAGNRSAGMRALLLVDLDNFKTLNDTLGHQTGDLLLREVARRLTACLREKDTVARLGGDEFAVLLENLNEPSERAAAEAERVGHKILAVLHQIYILEGRECFSTASIGITAFEGHRESMKDVMQQAEIAMYQAKAAGRQTLRFFSTALQAAVHTRASTEDDLRQGMKGEQFLLYYQPLLKGDRLVGAEALLRWNHPRRGLLPPGEFIGTAESTGLILPLGGWVLDAACRQLAAWAHNQDTAHLRIAVNISALQLHQPDFVETVLSTLSRTNANPQNLNLELTESMLVQNVEEVISKMTELKSHGLHFSLDDFGTGYSSLSYLKRLPLDLLKIDRSFVRDILVDRSSGAIAQAIISLSRALGLSVIAEGVETSEQQDCLARMGCNSFQGYLFSRPLPIGDFDDLLLSCPSPLTRPSTTPAGSASLAIDRDLGGLWGTSFTAN